MLFHWKAAGADLLVEAADLDDARMSMLQNIDHWRWQDPARFALIQAEVTGPPYYIAPQLHPITIDSKPD